MKKVALVTCYKKQNYVRASTLAKAITEVPSYELLHVKNRFKGLLRYGEVMAKLLYTRFRYRPDIYILTFRGYEMLLPVRLITIGKPLVFDEFINAEEWLIENKKLTSGSFTHHLFHHFYHLCLLTVQKVIADTQSHANYAAKLSNVPMSKYAVVAVGVDEHIFFPQPYPTADQFEVFYYSTENQPLHGMKYVCEAAKELSTKYPNMHFTLIGDGMEELVSSATEKGANITHFTHVPYKKIAEHVSRANVCLGGPFGNTLQSKFVVTGKTYQFMAAARTAIIGKNKETSRLPFVDKRNCLLVEQGSVQTLVEGLSWTYQNAEKLTGIGQRARKAYEEYFSNQQLHRTVTELIEGATN